MENDTTAVLPESAGFDLAAMTPAEGPVTAVAPGTRTRVAKAVGIGATVLVVGAVGFATLHSSSSSATANRGGPGGFGQGGPGGQGFGNGAPPGGGLGRDRGAGGSITAVSASSITLSTFRGTTETLTITKATTVTVDGAASTVSALTPGENVRITTSGSVGALTAVTIDANSGQGFGGGFGGPPGPQQGPAAQAPGTNGTTHT